MREEFAIIKLPEHVKLPNNDSIFKIRNQTNLDLYPALFFFDSCDLSISKSRYVLIM